MKSLRFKFKLKYLAILALAAILLGNRGFRSLMRNYTEYRKLRAEKVQLELQRGKLEDQLKATAEKAAIEKAARSGLNLIKPGETEYTFPPPKDTDK
jgi:cell division protein FtsB